jgi:ketosteroid isomerase-like protein
VSEPAEVIAGVTGKPVKHNDIDRDVWIQGSVAAGVPAEYGERLRTLTETIASGMGSRPNVNVQKVTGAPPIKFAAFAWRTARAWTWRGPIMTTITDLDDFKALDPFFRIIEKGLDGIADGGHFFDLLAEEVIFEYIITTPGYPRRVEGRKAVAELYRPYGTMLVLDRCHDLAVHHDIKTGVVVLEYASEGRVVSTGAPYTNRYISVLTITDRKVTHWRDYLDPVAVFDALGWPSR